MSEPTAMTVAPEVVRIARSVDELVDNFKKFEELKSRILTPTDWQIIAGKRFIKRSGWRKIAVAFNLSDEILRQEKEFLDDGSVVWRMWVRIKAPIGRTVDAVGSCSSREREFAHEDHDINATAHTRAKSRGISDMVGSGEVSAEEIASGDDVPEDSEPAAKTTKEIPAKFPLTRMISWSIPSYEEKAMHPLTFTRAESSYENFMRKRVMTELADRVSFSEKVDESAHITNILSSDMDERTWNAFESKLKWALAKIGKVKAEDVTLTMTEYDATKG